MRENIRVIDCLRISVTDRCNLRCRYCMPKEGIIHQPHRAVLTFEETERIARIFSSLGVKNIRITGGEPLIRKGIVSLLERLGRIRGIEEVYLTTNALLLSHYAEDLRRAGVKGINISLDTLRKERFRSITGRNGFNRVREGIEKAKQVGLYPIKINVVVMRGINDDEIIDFVNFAHRERLILRFIEFMKVTPLWRERFFISIDEIKDICRRKFKLQEASYKSFGPAEYYRVKESMIGFITTAEKNCKSCSRLRLTSTGELKLCLYQPKGFSLRNLLRKGLSDDCLRSAIKVLITNKENIDYRRWGSFCVYMSSVGG